MVELNVECKTIVRDVDHGRISLPHFRHKPVDLFRKVRLLEFSVLSLSRNAANQISSIPQRQWQSRWVDILSTKPDLRKVRVATKEARMRPESASSVESERVDGMLLDILASKNETPTMFHLMHTYFLFVRPFIASSGIGHVCGDQRFAGWFSIQARVGL